MRQIVLDTETTGIGPQLGHRIIEIGCVELIDRKLTGNHYHVYLNPQRDVEEGAFRVHGISTEFLKDKPLFAAIAEEFIAFIRDAELIIHNAPFDVGFLEAELNLINWPKPFQELCTVCDTLVLAREKHPGQRNSLDALCKRYEIDNSNRTLHGALLDAEILASVYLAMTGGQAQLFDEELHISSGSPVNHDQLIVESLHSNTPVIKPDQRELEKHREFIRSMVQTSGVNHWED
ncbi:DNA polymerase III subunit epsilon [Legionella spiritensis]|uniref:DNA polymerase III subunit epsilon n=1 Tax=Legionella spiritensis TaxID=452 RepID=A0A0W0Z548_LEGSP|nr:DNA polymerase III subunit epsilon [Legionella spiritensis]KTD64062.1 DNA polymerase III subunit epsilon [Legionella spiritensis]SNV37510.1 DNA polymerase III subunit epsilon [Legionella spiritensis]